MTDDLSFVIWVGFFGFGFWFGLDFGFWVWGLGM
jgi:hypothetical protein